MELKHVIEMLMIDITAEGCIGTIFALGLLIATFLGGGINPLIEALVNLI